MSGRRLLGLTKSNAVSASVRRSDLNLERDKESHHPDTDLHIKVRSAAASTAPSHERKSNIAILQVDKMSNAELATSYAALILADDGVDITVRSIVQNRSSVLSEKTF